MNRRGFLQGILAAGVAPSIIRVESLMKVWTPAALVTELFITDIIKYGHADYGEGFSKLLWPGLKEWWNKAYDIETLRSR